MYTLSKELKFEAAHALAKGYKGKCANIHGHSWVVKVAVSGEDLDKHGMVIDFATIKSVCSPVIEDMDHSLLLYEGDEAVAPLQQTSKKVLLFEENPTSEYLAQYLFYQWADAFHALGIRLVSVTVEETCTSACTYTEE